MLKQLGFLHITNKLKIERLIRYEAYILRQTDLNSEKRFQGHIELNDVGIAQSE